MFLFQSTPCNSRRKLRIEFVGFWCDLSKELVSLSPISVKVGSISRKYVDRMRIMVSLYSADIP